MQGVKNCSLHDKTIKFKVSGQTLQYEAFGTCYYPTVPKMKQWV